MQWVIVVGNFFDNIGSKLLSKFIDSVDNVLSVVGMVVGFYLGDIVKGIGVVSFGDFVDFVNIFYEFFKYGLDIGDWGLFQF